MHMMVKALPHKLLDADKTWFSSLKITSKFVLAKFQVCCTYHHPRRIHLHNRAGVRAGTSENHRYKINIKGTWVLSVWEWQQLMSTPKKYQFKSKKKIPKIKIPWSMCSRGSSHIIKIAMLISGILLSEKHPKTYQLGLWYFLPLKVTTSILAHFRSPSPPQSKPKNKDLPPSEKKSDLPQSPPTSKI